MPPRGPRSGSAARGAPRGRAAGARPWRRRAADAAAFRAVGQRAAARPEAYLAGCPPAAPGFWARRDAVVDLVPTPRVLVAVLRSGLALAFDRASMRLVCRLNHAESGQRVRSVCYNAARAELLLVSVEPADRFRTMRVAAVPLEAVARGRPGRGTPVFEGGGALREGSYVHFDADNGLAVTHTGRRLVAWRLDTLEQAFCVRDAAHVEELRACPGLLLLVGRQQGGHLPLRVLDARGGDEVCDLSLLIHRTRALEVVELFEGHLLVKQRDMDLRVVCLRTRREREVCRRLFPKPHALVFQHARGLFFAVHDRGVSAWNVRGERLARMDGCSLWTPGDHRCVCAVPSRGAVVAHCRGGAGGSGGGALRVYDAATGRLRATLGGDTSPADAEALAGAATLRYDEAADELLTAHADGTVRVWSNAAPPPAALLAAASAPVWYGSAKASEAPAPPKPAAGGPAAPAVSAAAAAAASAAAVAAVIAAGRVARGAAA